MCVVYHRQCYNKKHNCPHLVMLFAWCFSSSSRKLMWGRRFLSVDEEC
jgi:hypothetical protein